MGKAKNLMIKAIDNLDEILQVKGLDAIFIGPYDLSASMGIIGDFENILFINIINKIFNLAKKNNIPCGIHIVDPDLSMLKFRIKEGYQFIAYSIDSVLLRHSISTLKNFN